MGPIRGKTRPVPIVADVIEQKNEEKIDASIHNRFDIEVIDSKTGKIRQRAQAENVITNILWNYGPATSWMSYIWYGSGTGTPSSSDTKLFNEIAAVETTNEGTKYDIVNRVFKRQCKIQLSETTAVGKTITEVGCSNAAASGSLCTHAMLRDMNGNQISITKTATDIVNIYATSFVHWTEDIENKIIFPSYFVNVFSGKLDFSAPAYGFGGSFSSLELSSPPFYATNASVTATYSVANKSYKYTCARVAANSGNACGIKYINLYPTSGNNYYISVPINAENDISNEAIGTGDGVKKDFVTKFPFCSNAKIYLNSVQTEDVSIDAGYPFVIGKASVGSSNRFSFIEDIELSGTTVKRTTSYRGNGKTNPNGIYAFGDVYYNYYRQLYPTKVGIAYFYRSSSAISEISMSDDLVTWVNVIAYNSDNNIPLEYQTYKYIRIKSSDNYAQFYPVANRTSDNNIHFTTAPANGAVITGDYHTNTLGKDENHVYDFSLTIQFGEYTT